MEPQVTQELRLVCRGTSKASSGSGKQSDVVDKPPAKTDVEDELVLVKAVVSFAVDFELEKEFPEKRMRMDTSDGDVDKEANFTILMCRPPAILTENLFL